MSDSWRDQILNEFTPQVARLTLVADPDGLLLEEGVLQGIHERGFELIPFEDHVEFRFAYESRYRSRWDRGELTDLVVVLRSTTQTLELLPYDLLQAGRQLSFDIGDLFPNFSYPVVAAMDRCYLDQLYRAQQQNKPNTLGDNATKEFILLHVFEIASELIKHSSDLLRILLRRHFRGQSLPVILDERLIQILQRETLFKNWPLQEIIPDRTAFFSFLQERWPVFLSKLVTSEVKGVKEAKAVYNLEYSGPANIPFEHDDVRVYIDNLFLEGLLKPIEHEHADKLSNSWVIVGIEVDTGKGLLRRLDGLLKNVESTLPAEEARHQEWRAFAWRWAELTVLLCQEPSLLNSEVSQKVEELQKQVDESFLRWCHKRYAGLHNQPPVPPVMLHHVPKLLTRRLEQVDNSKIAMLVVDGLSLDQWIVMRKLLSQQHPELRFRENAVYAWLPTLTSVSRQALFAGKSPLYFPTSIQSTYREPALWSQFWGDQGLNPSQIGYIKKLGHGSLDEVEEMIANKKLKVAGFVVEKVDKIMHGMELGTAGMHNQVGQWINEGYFSKLVTLLHEHGFKIWLTSDHGNIEANGCGSPGEGVVADVRGVRVRIYPTEPLRKQIKQKFPDSIEWPSYGLPDEFIPLLAPRRSAFVREGKLLVGHGGISLEEVVVPLVEIERKTHE